MVEQVVAAAVDRAQLREQIQEKYCDVAERPEDGFHFHTGRPLAKMIGYEDADVDSLPESTIESFAGTGNPFLMGRLAEGETVVDVGCGAGFDTLLAAKQVGPVGRVIAVDMTEAMIEKTRAGSASLGLSNGVINLCPDKMAVMRELRRVLKPGGRFQIGDIIVQKEVPQDAKDDIDLWSG